MYNKGHIVLVYVWRKSHSYHLFFCLFYLGDPQGWLFYWFLYNFYICLECITLFVVHRDAFLQSEMPGVPRATEVKRTVLTWQIDVDWSASWWLVGLVSFEMKWRGTVCGGHNARRRYRRAVKVADLGLGRSPTRRAVIRRGSALLVQSVCHWPSQIYKSKPNLLGSELLHQLQWKWILACTFGCNIAW